MIQRTSRRTAVLAAATLALALTGCAPAAAPAEPATTAAPPASSALSTVPSAEPTPATGDAWPAGWTQELPHPTSGTVLYSHTERGALYKIGLVSTPEAFAALVAEFAAAGYTDQAGQGDEGDEGDEGAEVHNLTKDGWRVILRGVDTDAGFELHYLAKQER